MAVAPEAKHDRRGHRVLALVAATAAGVVLTGTAVSAAPAAESRTEFATIEHSFDVVAFFRAHSWLRAPRRIDCAQVPWEHTCRIARRVFAKHFTRIKEYRKATAIPIGETQIRAYLVQRVGEPSASCLASIIDMENPPWDPTIDYGGGHGNVYEAYGLPQAYPGTKMASAGADWRTNPKTQIEWMIRYTTERYGSPCGGWASRRDRGTY